MAASTQNQAFNSLLFLFRHALKREFGELRDVSRAKKSQYVQMVLSRAEIDAILEHLYYPLSGHEENKRLRISPCRSLQRKRGHVPGTAVTLRKTQRSIFPVICSHEDFM